MEETDEGREKRNGDEWVDGRKDMGGCGSHVVAPPPPTPSSLSLTLSPAPNQLPAISFRRGVGGLRGQIHSFPSHSGLQGSPRTPVPQYFQ